MGKLKGVIKEIRYWTAIRDGDVLWASSMAFNGLLKINLDSKSVSVEKVFDDIPYDAGNAFYAMVKVLDYIVFLPGAAEYIAIFSLKDKSIMKVNIPKAKIICNERYNEKDKFVLGVGIKDSVYIFGASYPAIIKLNVKTGHISEFTEWITKIEHEIPINDTHYFFCDGYSFENEVITVPMSCCNEYLLIDTRNDCMELFKPRWKVDGYECCVSWKQKVYLVARDKDKHYLCTHDIEQDMYIKTDLGMNDEGNAACYAGNVFYNPIVYNGKLLLFPRRGLLYYSIDMETGRINKRSFWDEYRQKWDCLNCLYMDGNKVHFFTMPDMLWHEYDLETEQLVNYSLRLADNDFYILYSHNCNEDIKKRILDNNWCIYENQISLEEYIHFCTNTLNL